MFVRPTPHLPQSISCGQAFLKTAPSFRQADALALMPNLDIAVMLENGFFHHTPHGWQPASDR